MREAEFEAYKQFVELADRSVSRRGEANKVFFTFNAALLSVQGLWGTEHNSNAMLIGTLGMGICLPHDSTWCLYLARPHYLSENLIPIDRLI